MKLWLVYASVGILAVLVEAWRWQRERARGEEQKTWARNSRGILLCLVVVAIWGVGKLWPGLNVADLFIRLYR
jgi:hypothetical protein